MKITVEEKEKTQKLKFPCLMASDAKTIILATGINSTHIRGIMLFCENKDMMQEVGLQNQWRIDCFKLFHGKIILENDL